MFLELATHFREGVDSKLVTLPKSLGVHRKRTFTVVVCHTSDIYTLVNLHLTTTPDVQSFSDFSREISRWLIAYARCNQSFRR
jgi:hypothetical protein